LAADSITGIIKQQNIIEGDLGVLKPKHYICPWNSCKGLRINFMIGVVSFHNFPAISVGLVYSRPAHGINISTLVGKDLVIG
jgi:hypothetical protein